MNLRRFGFALLVGVVVQGVVLLFGLHASLWFSALTGTHEAAYWLLNGIYFVVGLVLALIVVQWGPARWRILVSAVVLLGGLLIGLMSSRA